ncbi:hypothetical protein BXZ70DRAFT_903686 [Cristinia sonorae]|uniref:Uncharacterized protein n=1 Tax=Cristinia sonorae TaxID=1940300 RepID=A0A8K0XU58_9AGAR|nr:hypothetical protein BXZ70DRAFT_903686 [Cristinia sonorae]
MSAVTSPTRPWTVAPLLRIVVRCWKGKVAFPGRVAEGVTGDMNVELDASQPADVDAIREVPCKRVHIEIRASFGGNNIMGDLPLKYVRMNVKFWMENVRTRGGVTGVTGWGLELDMPSLGDDARMARVPSQMACKSIFVGIMSGKGKGSGEIWCAIYCVTGMPSHDSSTRPALSVCRALPSPKSSQTTSPTPSPAVADSDKPLVHKYPIPACSRKHCQVYCSDECESLDATSPSASASSSAYPSPYLRSTMNAPGNLADIPPLVPSALGGSKAHRGHRAQYSISSSSTSSAGWSALSDEEDEDASYPHVNIEGENSFVPEGYGEGSLKSSLHPHSALLYARRPSTTNHRSTIPLLHKRASSTSSPLTAPVKSPLRVPLSSPTAEDDLSDVPPMSLSSSVSSTRSRKDTVRPAKKDTVSASAHDASEDPTVSNKRRTRNRTSLPAYFSLLQMSPSSPPTSQSSSSSNSRQALANLSQSLRASPATPRLAHPLLHTAHAHAEPASRSATTVETTPRGRFERRNPETRSISGRRSLGRSPPRQPSRTKASSPSPCRHHPPLGSQARARLDSVEKVFEWVSNSPSHLRGRTVTRRNSSPPAKPNKRELAKDTGAVRDLYTRCMQQAVLDDEEMQRPRRKEDIRGRRTTGELDDLETNPDAPGYGNGRSGLKTRERQRGRTAGFR